MANIDRSGSIEDRLRWIALLYVGMGAFFTALFIWTNQVEILGISLLTAAMGIGLWQMTVLRSRRRRKRFIVKSILASIRTRISDEESPPYTKIGKGMWDMAVQTNVIADLDIMIFLQLFALFESIDEYNQLVDRLEMGSEPTEVFISRMEKTRKVISLQLEEATKMVSATL